MITENLSTLKIHKLTQAQYGRDFAAGEFLPMANYCIDTAFTPAQAGTYTDSTGTVTT